MSQNNIESMQKLFLSLSDVTRLRILEMLCGGERSVGEFVGSLKEPQPKISRHLATLRDDGIVTTRRDGKNIYYAIAPAGDAYTLPVLASVLRALSRDSETVTEAISRDISDITDISDEVGGHEHIENSDELPIFLL
ncbi:MAG: winged helix-turn-helix transcriptional regulator [Acidobacteriota bacterium]|nr:MAG: winged helix-turn-helix transcriptional regulator [Acidobacteriota bacterium]